MNTLKEISGYSSAIFTKIFREILISDALWLFLVSCFSAFISTPASRFGSHQFFFSWAAIFLSVDVAYLLGRCRKRQEIVLPTYIVALRVLRYCFDTVLLSIGFVLDFVLNNDYTPQVYQVIIIVVLMVIFYCWGRFKQAKFEKEQNKRDTRTLRQSM